MGWGRRGLGRRVARHVLLMLVRRHIVLLYQKISMVKSRMSIGLCSISVPCPSGSEYNYVTSSCDPCPLGYFREEARDPACLKCPPGHTTVATSSRDCVRRPGE